MKEMTTKAKETIDEYLETGDLTQAVRNNYDTVSSSTVSAIASKLRESPTVREYLETASRPAVETIFNLSQNAEAEAVKLNASKDILDRAGYKPVEKVQSVSLEIKGDVEDFAKLDEVRLKYEAELRNKIIEQ